MRSDFIILLTLISILILFFFTLFWIEKIYAYRDLRGEPFFTIKEGDSFNSIINNLEKKGLIDNKFLFKVYLFSKGFHKRIQPGEYNLKSRYSLKELAELIIKTNFQNNDVEVRILEGETNLEIAQKLEKAGVLNADQFYNLSKNFDNSGGKYVFLPKDKSLDLEGYLFPDTYRFPKNGNNSQSLAREIIEKMLDNFNKKVYKEISDRINSIEYSDKILEKDLRKIIIIASMLEKEIQTKEDMEIVSGILWKRLKNNIPLQVDATLVYIKCNSMIKYCRKISDQDKKIESPYNTYLFQGLPIGAISNPGLTAIKSALNPKESEYWYYLSKKDDGKTVFSVTLEEHNLNRQKYLR